MKNSIITIVLILSLICAVEVGAAIDVVDCGGSDSIIRYKDYKLSDVLRNKFLLVNSGTALLSQNITSGTVHFSVAREGNTLLEHTFDYCGNQKFDLPLKIGVMNYYGSDCKIRRPILDSFGADVKVPWFTPWGKYEVTFKGETTDNRVIFCLRGTTHL